MSRKLLALAAILMSLSAASGAHAAKLALFTDPTFIDAGGELPNLRRCLVDSLGHELFEFSGTTDPDWAAALSGADALVIPEIESLDLFAALPGPVRTRVRNFVETDGHGLVLCGDFFETPSNAVILLNGIFSFTIEFAGEPGVPATFDSTAAVGTPYAGGFATLPSSNGTYEVVTASLPAGTRAMYTAGLNTSVFSTDFGAGRIDYLGFDWFTAPPIQEWTHVLGSAVIHAAGVPGKRVVVYNEETFVDVTANGEPALMAATFSSLGHAVTTLVGTDPAVWEATLANADVFVIPELEKGVDLAAALPADTRDVLAGYVTSGGGLILCADSASPRRCVAVLTQVLGFPALTNGTTGLTSTLNAGDAAGTPFSAGPSALPAANATRTITTASLPGGTRVLYNNGVNAIVFATDRGWGRVVYFAFDWFEEPTPFAWRSVAQHTVTFAAGPRPFALNAPAVAAGATAQVTADLSSFAGLTISNLRFRQGGDANFLTVPLVQSAPTSWSATIPGSSVSAKGLQFFLELGDGARTGTSPLLASGIRTHNIPVNLANHEVASLPAGGYRLRGLPIQAANPNPVAVFDELGAYNIKNWRYGTFNGSGYVEPNAAAFATPGQGFWIVSKDARAIASPGTSTNLAGPVVLTLRQGFNQIANPFAFPVDFAAVVRPTEVEANLIGFNGSAYVPNVATLLPGEGYWIKNNGPGNRNISIPPLGVGVAAAPRPVVSLAEGAEWALRVDARAGRFADEANLFGARVGASEGRDAFDLSEPPPAPEGWVRAGFASSSDGELLCDWRPAGNEGATWQVSFASDQAGEDFSIDLSVERALPEGWSVLVFEGAREVELDAAMQISGRVGSTTAPRVFTVSVGSSSFLGSVRTDAEAAVTTFSLAAPFPNPSSAGVSIDLAVPSPVADARVEVFDVQGRRVQTLLEGAVERGIQRVAWDGRTNTGERASAGVYFMKARAGSFSASRKVVLLP